MNLLVHNYYYRYREYRNLIKNMIISDEYTGARNILEDVVSEHDNYINSHGIQNDGNNFTSVDNFSLHHAFDHIRGFISRPEELLQKDATIGALDES